MAIEDRYLDREIGGNTCNTSYGFAKLHRDGSANLPYSADRDRTYLYPKLLGTVIRSMAYRDPLPVIVIDRGKL